MVASLPILVAPIMEPVIQWAPAIAKPPLAKPPPPPAVQARIAQRIDAAFLVPDEEPEWDVGALGLTDLRAVQKNSDEARLRRAHLAKYVKAVVGACGVVCLLAVGRLAVASATPEPRVAETRATAALPVPVPVIAPERFDPAPTMTSALATNTHVAGKGDRAHYARRHGK